MQVRLPPTHDVVASTTDDLFDDLNNLALDLCRATVTIHKQVRTGPGGSGLTDGAGWIFGAPSAAPTTATTDGDGLASLEFDHDHLGLEVITEAAPAGAPPTAIESVQCVKTPTAGQSWFRSRTSRRARFDSRWHNRTSRAARSSTS